MASASAMRTPIPLRSKLSLRQRQTRNATTSTAATAAMISRADIRPQRTSAGPGHERARDRGRGPLRRFGLLEDAEAAGPGAADGGAEGAACDELLEPAGQVGAEREGGLLEVVVEGGREVGGVR